ncbi:YkgJ family cysteine cluster protein, partial [bacterium]|nr:YkgJ family cysteine cluster protein [bacterium]
LKKLKKFYYLKILKKRYFRCGKCLKCGCCCENIYVRHNGDVIKTQEEFENIKNNDSYSFYHHISVIGKDDFGLIFECNKFDKEKRICKDHKNRPSICRNYPSEEIFSFGAQLQDKCGFSFEPIEKFDEILSKISKKPAKNFELFDETKDDESWNFE